LGEENDCEELLPLKKLKKKRRLIDASHDLTYLS